MENQAEGSPYRVATEFEGGRRDPGHGPLGWYLRAFPDGNDVLRAGLYETEVPAIDDHWAHGTVLTDETDAKIAERLLPGDPAAQADALTGLAYTRVEKEMRQVVRLLVPRNLRRWIVRMPAGETEPEHQVAVRATGQAAAIAVAALGLIDAAQKEWTATQWE